MRSTKTLVLLLMVVAALSLAVACGGGDDEEPTTAPAAAVATATTAPAAQPTATTAPAPQATVKLIKIGLLSPQTGPIAQYAPGFEDAGKVAISEINEAYPGFKFELIVVDSGCDGTQAATAAQSLVDAGVVVIVGAACSGATL
ncbi:MAG: ABC transporter substrate-binding protein, partial [Chloroflexi bacterium]|nr:ABC transporter substrate-binding protein [Chloroflexota bacterium]